jgi:glycosyltransferase involved in cell wall biosynthesis
MWSFTGNAAHTFGNLSWKSLQNDAHLTRVPPSIGLNTGGWLLRQKKNIYKRSNLTIVTPSEWLRGLAEQSPVFEGKKIVRIYNGINPEVFKPANKPECKRIMGFAPDSKVVMFSAEYLNKNNPWKGGTDLLEILSRMNKSVKGKINLLVLGKSKPKEIDNFSNFDVHYKGYVSNEREMCNYLNASDLFIYPTRADNLPNVLVESIASGTPCITFNVGGNSEIIIDGENGIVVEPFNFDDFARKALTLLDEEERLAEYSEKGLGLVRKRFQLKEMIDQYYQVFDEVKKKN